MRGALLFALAVTITAGATAEPLRVVTSLPQGDLNGSEPERIQVVFSTPIVPLGTVEVSDTPPAWLHIEPRVAARWRWAGTAELIGEPLAPLPRAVLYTATVAAGVVAVDGSVLAERYAFSFATPGPRLAVVPAVDGMEATFDEASRWDARDGWAWRQVYEAQTDLLSLAVLLIFDQPVEASSVRAHLRLTVSGRPVDTVFESDPEHPDTVFVVSAPGCWPEGAEVDMEVAAGIVSLQGPRLSERTVRRRWSVPKALIPKGFSGATVVAGGALDPERAELVFTSPVTWQGIAGSVTFRSRGTTAWQRPRPQPGAWYWSVPFTSLPLAPLALGGGEDYEVCVAAGAVDAWGRIAPRRWCGVVETGHRMPRFYLVEGDGVVEWDGPHLIPLRTCNVTGLRLSLRRLAEDELVAQVARRSGDGSGELAGHPLQTLETPVDRVSVVPVDLDPALAGHPGVVLVTVEAADVVPGSAYDDLRWLQQPLTAVTQVTALGLTVKSSGYEGILVWVTRLADAAPVVGATVTVRDEDNSVLWSGTSDVHGLARTPDDIALPGAALVTARLGDDLAYARTRWYEGHRGWEFNLPVEVDPRPPVVGVVWADRGVARPGESVHLKAVVRRRSDDGLTLPGATGLVFAVRDSRGTEVTTVPAVLDRWGGAEMEMAVPATAPLGTWVVTFGPEPIAANEASTWNVSGSFQVAEFRRPKVRVQASAVQDLLIAGDTLKAEIEGRFLAGGVMAGAPARWSVRADRADWRPPGGRWQQFELLPAAFGSETARSPERTIATGEGALGEDGFLAFEVARTPAYDGWPALLTVEAEIVDVDNQTTADRTTALVLPGAVMVGVKRPGAFVATSDGVATAVVAVDSEGRPVAGVEVAVELQRRHWESVRRREVSGRYVYESRPVTKTVATASAITGEEPVEVTFSPAEGGFYAVVARAGDGRGNRVEASADFYVLGGGYTPWRMDEENRVEVVPERPSYGPGETARLLVKSPWPEATALITVERAGVLEARVERLGGSMPTIEVPVLPVHAPNVFVSVVLLRGRMAAGADPEMADPGRPAYRIGIAEITVAPTKHRLQVAVRPAQPEYRPGMDAVVELQVSDAGGTPQRASVTMWAVDAGILDLTRYRPPDLVDVFFARRGLGVVTAESRSRVVGRRSYGTKADAIGGGGGGEVTGADVRRDFRPLAVWRNDVVTGADGRAVIRFTLPDALTTYRVLAVAVGERATFGVGQAELTVTVPIGLEPALPRFLRPGDRARAGVVVRNRTGSARTVGVRLDSSGTAVSVEGARERSVSVVPGGSAEVAFPLEGNRPGSSRLRFSLDSEGETDALEVALEVMSAAREQVDSTFFTAAPHHEEAVQLPSGASPDVGGLELSLAPSLLVGVRPGFTWLAGYRYDCAEQVASRLLGRLAARRMPELPLSEIAVGDGWLQHGVDRLLACRRPDGGFTFWPEGGESDRVLTAHVLWALHEAAAGGAGVDATIVENAAAYLSRALRQDSPSERSTAEWTSRVLISLALARAGRAEPGYFQGLFDDRAGAPAWGKALLAVAMNSAESGDPRVQALRDEVASALVVEARTARLEEVSPPWGWRVWWSEPRASAAALLALLDRADRGELVERLVRGLVDHLGRDRHRTTHDVAWELQALAAWRSRTGAPGGSVAARVDLGGRRLVSTEVGPDILSTTVPIAELNDLAGRGGGELTLEVGTERGGTLYGSATLRFSPLTPPTASVSRGLSVRQAFFDTAGRSVEGAVRGDEVTLAGELECPATCRFVVVELPLPAGVEPADPMLATTARRLLPATGGAPDRPGFDHVEYRDDRIVLFATELPPGSYRETVPCRATTAGSFVVAPAHAEAMYAPEIFATTAVGSFVVTAGK